MLALVSADVSVETLLDPLRVRVSYSTPTMPVRLHLCSHEPYVQYFPVGFLAASFLSFSIFTVMAAQEEKTQRRPFWARRDRQVFKLNRGRLILEDLHVHS